MPEVTALKKQPAARATISPTDLFEFKLILHP